jgi:hypothetical protein
MALLILYHLLRFAAASCTGASCDAFTLPSLAVPFLAWVAASLAAVTGIVTRPDRRPFWAALTAVAVAGPILAITVLRNHPDAVVWTLTAAIGLPAVLAALTPRTHTT